VIAPESCSAILWRDRLHAVEAAEALKLTPEDLKRCHLIDEIIPEPEGGAQNDPAGMAKCLGSVLERQLRELQYASPDELVDSRHKKFRAMGASGESSAAAFFRLRLGGSHFRPRVATVHCPEQQG